MSSDGQRASALAKQKYTCRFLMNMGRIFGAALLTVALSDHIRTTNNGNDRIGSSIHAVCDAETASFWKNKVGIVHNARAITDHPLMFRIQRVI